MSRTGEIAFVTRFAEAAGPNSAYGRRIAKLELTRSLAALVEDDGAVDAFERAAVERALAGPEFTQGATEGAREVARDFVAGVFIPAQSAWLGAVKRAFSAEFVASAAPFVSIPASLEVTDLANVPAPVRDAFDRVNVAREGNRASVYRIPLRETSLFAVYSSKGAGERVSVFSAEGNLLVWGEAHVDGGFFWD
jgi:hypothetical protein